MAKYQKTAKFAADHMRMIGKEHTFTVLDAQTTLTCIQKIVLCNTIPDEQLFQITKWTFKFLMICWFFFVKFIFLYMFFSVFLRHSLIIECWFFTFLLLVIYKHWIQKCILLFFSVFLLYLQAFWKKKSKVFSSKICRKNLSYIVKNLKKIFITHSPSPEEIP